GQGQLLLDLAWYGFNDPIGADKFIKDGLVYDSNVRVYKKDLAQMDGKFDVIMLHHSFEHMPEPDAVMPEIKRLLNENGTVLVRMPIIGTYAWNNYRQNWVALDAPRHLIIYTMKAFEILCTRHGFKITRKIFDSSEFQFIGSEQYMRNIPIYNDSRSYYVNAKNSIFTKSDVRSFKKKTKKLNTEQNGDSVCLYLSKIRE
ncbi:MAG: methyltransferase domain-containing protein, partial [Candidatus Omnitrophota bacterium]